MRLTTKSRYGTRLIIDLAIYGREKPIPLGEVARRQNISVKYLEQLVRKLKEEKMITSHRGPFGGHMLAKDPKDISVGDIVRTLEESTAITDCAEEDEKLCGICNQAGDCLSRWVWVEAGKAMFKRLDKISIANLLQIRNDGQDDDDLGLL
ncbi:MAG: Rrf2 family transcriptional regulator [Proteobacteria bacterium]|nr:Rrf2 family transcriptional regulator [Pseudomonadota bacterium]MBU1386783.1 Rrf2 family transcriptional regulator [Pseudomonadota bacterium]MBU1544727.1 Rrf2 family transcriptional regulator [Pseudomonadota bacterium]MBU2429672.1 Rrf2 family transcriptional regulator [Pseudomonadota bacterium]MBU2481854.1 Rrf2 family transcriptional regulator [Pseudomonadota bacterium]